MARDRREIRRLEKMQREREKEKAKKNRAPFIKGAASIAATAGIGYVAIRNKDFLLDQVSSVVGKAGVTLNRNSSGFSKFIGKMDEAKDLNKALQSTYGEASPVNVLNALADRKGKHERFTDTMRHLNTERIGRGLKSVVPKDMARTQDALINSSFNRYKATQEAAQLKLKEVLSDDKYAEAFGDKVQDVERVLRENPKLLINDQTRGIKRTDGQYEQMPKSILDTFIQHNKNEDKTINFNIDGKEEQSAFVEKMFEASQEVYDSIQTQRAELRTGKVGKDNYISAYNQLFDYTTMHGLREGHQPQKSLFNQSMQKEGFRNITMGEARDLYVIETPEGLRTTLKDAEGSKSLQDLFTPNVTTKETKGFADRYINKGIDAGFSLDDLTGDIFSQSIFLNESTGEIINTTAPGAFMEELLDYTQDNYQIPIIRVNPLDMTNRRINQQQSLTPGSAVYQSGEIHPFLAKGRLSVEGDLNVRNKYSVGQTDRPYLHMGETIYDASIVEELLGQNKNAAKDIIENRISEYEVADGYELINIGQGATRRMAEVYSGRTNRELQDRSALGRIWGSGQESESNFEALARWYNQFESPEGADNILSAHFAETFLENSDVNNASNLLDSISDTLDARSTALSLEAGDALHEEIIGSIKNELPAYLNDQISPVNLTSDEGVFELAQQIVETASMKRRTVGSDVRTQMVENLEEQLSKTVRNNRDNPDAFLKRKYYMRDNGAVGDMIQDAVGGTRSQTQTGAEQLRQTIEQYGIALADKNSRGEDLLQAVTSSSVRNKKDVLSELDYMRSNTIADFFSQKAAGIEDPTGLSKVHAEFQGFLAQNESSALHGMNQALKIAEPWNTAGVSPKEEFLLKGTRTTAIKKRPSFVERMQGVESRPETVGDAVLDITEQIARQGIDYAKDGFNVTTPLDGEVTAGHIFPWRLGDNLDRRLQDIGLGLPNYMKKTPASTIANQFGRRILLPYVAFQQAKWFDDMVLQGQGSKALAQTYANMHLDIQGIKEGIGINQIGRNLQEVMPWSEHIEEWVPSKLFNAATFGALSDFRSQEDTRRYYESGEDPVRSSRYWGMGSSGAWMGRRIDRYTPNWYRETMSDWQYTDTMYGSRREYWANNWMPTLSNPLAPLNRFIVDPYHWENKHAQSRPYAVTGGFSELQAIPLAGPYVDRAVSSVLKPEIKNRRLNRAHEEYMLQYSGALAENYINMNAPGVMNVSPGGGASISGQLYRVNTLDEDGFLDEETLRADDIRFETERYRMTQNLQKGPARGTAQERENAALAQTNQTIAAYERPVREPSLSQAGRFGDATQPMTLDEVYNPNRIFSRHGVTEGFLDNLSSFSGMQGFIRKTFFGFDVDDQRTRYLQTSNQFNDYSRRFWDKGLGGLGGDISEIGRRYFDDEPQDNRYNPIRNTMPSWLPGQEYFIDFLHGDPFSRVPQGEIRLPGAAYESLYNVRKDAGGNYSAFDRYRILADVAPYSDQYRLARKEVALLNQNNLLDEDQQQEYREIREQVSSKNKKHNFYERRFKNANINQEVVTVDRVLDQNTFISKEYPNTPMKFAGVSVNQQDQSSIDLIRQVVKPGQKVTVALDADPQNRLRDDMLGTTRVVVYAGRQGIGSELRTGENLNFRLAQNSKENGGEVSVRDDGSAVATHALTSQGYLTIGKLSEYFVHDLLPNVPIVNLFADVFLPVRSPLEEYKKQIYSKSFRDWKSPVEGWIRPMLERSSSINPLQATLHGAGIGYLTGRQNRWNKVAGFGLTFGVLAGVRSAYDFGQEFLGDGERWIPQRRQEEREMDDYFDQIKYIKYKGLYEQTVKKAKKEEGIDLELYFREQEERGQNNKNIESYLKEKKKWLTITQKTSKTTYGAEMAKEEIKEINDQIKGIDADRPAVPVGSYAALALRYRDEYESTIHGAQYHYDYLKIYRALPKKEKEFFTAFQKAAPEERLEIIDLVPKNQRRFYQRAFGMEEDPIQKIGDFSKEYYVPDSNWEGWRPEVSLDNIRVKVMKEEGMELTEANYWTDSEMAAEESGVEAIDIQGPGGLPLSYLINKGRLKEALEGEGLKDVRISMQASASEVAAFNTQLQIERQREEEIEEGIYAYMNN